MHAVRSVWLHTISCHLVQLHLLKARIVNMLDSTVRPNGEKLTAKANILETSGSGTRLWIYLLPIVSAPLAVLLFALLIVPTNWFLRKAGASFPYLMNTGSGADVRNADCQVVIYGDSTAMYAINPEIIQRRTGLTACNIADIEGETIINGTLILDQYLQKNKRPQFILFFYTPEGMNPQALRSDPVITKFEAVTYRLRQPHRFTSLVVLMRHPEDVFSWAEHGMLVAIESVFSKPPKSKGKHFQYRPMGQIDAGAKPLLGCTYGSHADHPDKEWVTGLRSEYGTQGTIVLVDAMYLPECDPDVSYFQHELSGVVDDSIKTLPVSDYYVGGRHVKIPGSVPISNMVADQILQRLTPTS